MPKAKQVKKAKKPMKGGSTKTIVVSTPRRRSQQQPHRIVIRASRSRSPSPAPIIIRSRRSRTPSPAPIIIRSRRSRTPSPAPIIIRSRRSRTPSPAPIIIRSRRSRTPSPAPIIIRSRRSRTPAYSYPVIYTTPRRRRSRRVAVPVYFGTRAMPYSAMYPAFGTRRPTKVVSSAVSLVPSRSGTRVVRHSRTAAIPAQPQRKPTKLSWFAKNILRKKQAKNYFQVPIPKRNYRTPTPQNVSAQGWQQISLK